MTTPARRTCSKIRKKKAKLRRQVIQGLISEAEADHILEKYIRKRKAKWIANKD